MPIARRISGGLRLLLSTQRRSPGRVHRRVEQRTARLSLPVESAALMMTYDQLRELSRHGHIVGSHTMTHPNMAYLNEDEAQRELGESKQRLEIAARCADQALLLSRVLRFRRIGANRPSSRAVALGYETGVTTNSGLTRRGDNPLCLKRLHPTKTVEGLRWNLESAFAGRTV